MPPVKNFKVVIFGTTSVGKTSIISRFVKNDFPDEHLTTPLPIMNSKDLEGVQLTIWDTAGSEEWQAFNSSVYHGTEAAVLTASFDSQASFDELKTFWIPKISENINISDVFFILAVNKVDLEEDQRSVEESDIQQTIEDIRDEFHIQIEAVQVSAKNNTRIDELFLKVARKLKNKQNTSSEPKVNINQPTSEEKKSCC